MRFGLFFQVPEAPGRTHAERYGEMLDLVTLADSLGFDVAWLAELHFGGAFSLLASPLMAVPVIAQRTRRIRVGTAVTLLPLHHPLSCAEQAATADLLSGGRLEFGVGRGSIPSQFHGFRVPVAENRARFDEALEIIRLAWTRERFSYRGAFYEIDDVEVVPKPVQQPHPPIRVAVHTAESFAHIGDLGLPIYSGTTTTPLPQLREYMALYRARLAAGGHAWQREQMALMLPVHLAATRTAAREAMRPGVLKYYRNLRTIFAQLPESYRDHLPRLRMIEETLADLPYEKFCREQGVFGDTAEVIDRLRAVRDEFDLSQIICWFDQGSMLRRDEVERTMRRFADHVMPKLA
ncbi:MAG TPA: LLM class flavin-dependent oxidoreductase [Methylomirabilota bacterium]|jgi:alkanesulfonate monooxygenase SsuD/methylene tetrahydromethanopterin reductase-like flavin-dependent oxidoreductase (luciferase family)